SITGNQTIAVQPAAASSVLVSGFPSPNQAGVAGTVTLTAVDVYGNMATGYNGTIHFTSSDGQAVLPADYTFTAGDNGVHRFSATLKTAGSQSLTATDSATNSITGTQPITVQPAALLGDFNCDGNVEADDYVTWRKNNGTNNALANDNGLGIPV